MATGAGEPRGGGRIPAIAALVIIAAALIALGFGLNRVAGANTASGIVTPPPTPTPVPTPTPTPTPLPTPTPSPIAYADCSKATFATTPLAPLSQPSDVHKYSAAPAMAIDPSKLYQATIKTAKGDMVMCLQPSLAPTTVNVLVTLIRNHFYDGLKFHRVVADFVIQGGDPTGSGSGGPGFSFADEPVHQSYVDGTLAMANSGPNTNGSQFFICIGSQCSSLQPKYNLFGKLESGLDVAKKIAQGDIIESITVRQQQ